MATVTGPLTECDGDRRYYAWTIDEINVGPTTDITLSDVPVFGTITVFEALKSSGSASTLNPQIGYTAGFVLGTPDGVAGNLKPAAYVCNRTPVPYVAWSGKLVVRPQPDTGTNNTVKLRIAIAGGHR